MVFQEILLSTLSVVITGLVTWGISALTSWLNSKTKNEKLQKLISDAGEIIVSATKCTTQTYVDALKGKDMFTKEAQKEAFEKTKSIVLAQLSEEAKALIIQAYGDLDAWLQTKIEATLYDMKNGAVLLTSQE